MERTISVEEKIRRAEEIYNKRNNPDVQFETKTIDIESKSFIKRKMKKIFIQMSVCIIIYVILNSTDFGGTIFSEDTVGYIKTFLTQDIDFQGIYKSINDYIQTVTPKENIEEQNNMEHEGMTNIVEENVIPNTNIINNEENNTNIITNEVKDMNPNESVETQESNVDIMNSENNIGGAVEVEEVNNEALNEQKTQMELDAEYILSKVNFIKPVENYQISSRYGVRNPTTSTVPKNHTGIDLAAERGTKIVSATDGTVVLASSKGDYGNHLKIQIDNIVIVYAHCERLYVVEGEQIHNGQEIAEVGSSGNSTGPHLHFEIRVDNRVVDPEYIMEF